MFHFCAATPRACWLCVGKKKAWIDGGREGATARASEVERQAASDRQSGMQAEKETEPATETETETATATATEIESY